MPRGAAVLDLKDVGQVVHMADMFPGALVVEANGDIYGVLATADVERALTRD